MGFLSSFSHPERGYKEAQDELRKYYDESQRYLNPYNQHGQEAYGGMNEAMKRLLNPIDLENEWNKAYKESDAAKLLQGLNTEHGLSAISSMGLMGSTPALQAIQGGNAKVALDERDKFMKNLMEKYLHGIDIGKNIYGIGANTATNMANNAMHMGENSANLEYGKHSAGGNMANNLLGIAGGIAGSALGGPIGGAIGGTLAKHWNLTGKSNGS